MFLRFLALEITGSFVEVWFDFFNFLNLFSADLRLISLLIDSLYLLKHVLSNLLGAEWSSFFEIFRRSCFKLWFEESILPERSLMDSSFCEVLVQITPLFNNDLAVFIILPLIDMVQNCFISVVPLAVLGIFMIIRISLFSIIWSCCSNGGMKIQKSMIGRMYVM